jgi:hypothetical protein
MTSSIAPDLRAAKLKLVRLGIDTYRENVAYGNGDQQCEWRHTADVERCRPRSHEQ